MTTFSSILVIATLAISCASAKNNSEKPAKPAPVVQNAKKKNSQHSLEDALSKYKNVKTLTAEFTQRQKNVTLGSVKESSGRIFIKRPNKFRWETHEPEKSILVGNGKKVWFYTAPFREGEKGQVMTRVAADVQSQLAIDLLAGQARAEKDFQVKELEENHYNLKPLKPAGDVARIELFIEKPTNLVYKLVLFTSSGNETALTLKNVTLGPDLGDAMFNFVPPENTEEIQ